MNATFLAYVDQLPILLERLVSAPALDRLELQDDPRQGVYVFYEGNRAIVLGRSDHLKDYLMGQGRPGGDNFNAPIAFGIAKETAIAAGYAFPTNAVAVRDSTFKPYFDEAKARVARMRIRVVEVKDPVVQWLLVVYGSLELQTSNTFETT